MPWQNAKDTTTARVVHEFGAQWRGAIILQPMRRHLPAERPARRLPSGATRLIATLARRKQRHHPTGMQQ
jgi:hypothetical protein